MESSGLALSKILLSADALVSTSGTMFSSPGDLGISAFLTGYLKPLEQLGGAPEDLGQVCHVGLVLVLGSPGLLLPQLLHIRDVNPGGGGAGGFK